MQKQTDATSRIASATTTMTKRDFETVLLFYIRYTSKLNVYIIIILMAIIHISKFVKNITI